MNTTTKKVKICLVGTGRMGQLRAPHFVGNVKIKLACVVDASRPAGESFCAKYEVPFFETIEDAATEINCDAVWISTPTPFHDATIKSAVHCGFKTIFVEKPVAESPAEISEIFEFCQKAGVTLCCGFQRRWDASYKGGKDALKAGKAGRPLMATLFNDDSPMPPMEFLLNGGGNILLDMGPHDIDYIRWALEDEVEEVSAQGMSSTKDLEQAGVLDNAVVHLKFCSGVICTIMISRGAAYGYDQRVEFFGSLGRIQVADQTKNSVIISDGSGIHQDMLKFSFPQRFFEAFAAEVDTFADTCLGLVHWPVTEKDCCMVQAITEQASKSFLQGGKTMTFMPPEKFAAAGA